VVEGPKLVAEAIASGLDVRHVYAEGEDVGRFGATRVAVGVLGRVLDTATPQPVAAIVALPTWTLAEVMDRDGMVVVADVVGDPGNVGTIARSLEAFGGAGLVLTEGSADPFQPKVVRSSAGAMLRLAVVDGASVAGVVAASRNADRPLVVTTLAGGVAPASCELRRAAVVVGNEAHGVSPEFAAHADLAVSIPMAGPTESLNVAMAATLLAYESTRS